MIEVAVNETRIKTIKEMIFLIQLNFGYINKLMKGTPFLHSRRALVKTYHLKSTFHTII